MIVGFEILKVFNRTENGSNIIDQELMSSDDAAWALTCAFLILTMQTGFAMLEGGCVSMKNMANIMIKNVCDVSIGGMAYWMFGYGLTYGKPGTAFIGTGDFFFHENDKKKLGSRFAHYFFQFSFASTATTIVSGAVAERMKLHAYMVFSFLNIIIYAIPASWCWSDNGFLKTMGFYDFAGVCVVHLNGGTSALVSAWMLGPRAGRFEKADAYAMSSPVTALTGMFMLTWAWLGFNCGSTFGVTDHKWKISAVVAVATLNGAIGGGLVGLLLSMIYHKGQVRVNFVITSILGGLVSVTGVCSIISTFEALVVGAMGAFVAIVAATVLEKVKIDDPVDAIPVHFAAAFWGNLAIGIFGKDNLISSLDGRNGLLHGGGGMLLGANVLAAVIIITWSGVVTFLMLSAIKMVIGIRMSPEDEYVGADYVEHNIHSLKLTERLEEALRKMDQDKISKLIERLFDEISKDINPKTNAEANAAIKILRKGSIPETSIVTRHTSSRPQSTPLGHHLSARSVRCDSSINCVNGMAPAAICKPINGIHPINASRIQTIEELLATKPSAIKRRGAHDSNI